MASQLLGVSIAGDIQHTLQHWLRLSSIRPIAAAITRHPMWLTPNPTQGRTLQYRSLLGPLFCLNVISDAMMDPYARDPQPSVRHSSFCITTHVCSQPPEGRDSTEFFCGHLCATAIFQELLVQAISFPRKISLPDSIPHLRGFHMIQRPLRFGTMYRLANAWCLEPVTLRCFWAALYLQEGLCRSHRARARGAG